MPRTILGMLLTILAVALLVMLTVGSAIAQNYPDTYQVNYYSNAHVMSAPDGKVRIDNPGTDNALSLCADIYVFDNTEEMLECCGCLMTPDGLRTFSINNDLTGNPGNGITPSTGVIKILSALPNPNAGHPKWGKCDPTGGFSFTTPKGNIVPTPDLRAWATHIQNMGPSGSYPATSTEFQDATLAPWELAYLQQQCFLTRQLGSTTGACKCGTGD